MMLCTKRLPGIESPIATATNSRLSTELLQKWLNTVFACLDITNPLHGNEMSVINVPFHLSRVNRVDDKWEVRMKL